VAVSRRKPTSPRVAARQDRIRGEIIAVTRKLLTEGPVAEFTLDQVADALGITKPAIYHYFVNREALISAAVTYGYVEHARVLSEAARAAADGPAVLRAITNAFVNHYSGRLEEFRLDFAWTQIHGKTSEAKKSILPAMNEMVDEVAAKLRRGTPMSSERARRLCVAAWTAGLGLVSALSVTDANGTSLAHTTKALLAEIEGLFAKLA
jgi:AcrR family transcriptional regulator